MPRIVAVHSVGVPMDRVVVAVLDTVVVAMADTAVGGARVVSTVVSSERTRGGSSEVSSTGWHRLPSGAAGPPY
jgi:hypothetical protein